MPDDSWDDVGSPIQQATGNEESWDEVGSPVKSVEDKRKEREPVADAVADSIASINGVPQFITKALLSSGGRLGDLAIGSLTPIAGAAVGAATGGIPGAVVGGGVGGASGDTLVQARRILRGEQDDFKAGEIATSAAASAIPIGAGGPLLKSAGKVIATRTAQGGLIGASAETARQAIDEDSLDLRAIVSSGLISSLFGGVGGAVESVATRGNVLNAIRQTPEFKSFKGSDSELVDAVRARMASKEAATQPAPPVEKNVTNSAAPEDSSIITQSDSALGASKGNAQDLNAQANKIATAPPAPTPSPIAPKWLQTPAIGNPSGPLSDVTQPIVPDESIAADVPDSLVPPETPAPIVPVADLEAKVGSKYPEQVAAYKEMVQTGEMTPQEYQDYLSTADTTPVPTKPKTLKEVHDMSGDDFVTWARGLGETGGMTEESYRQGLSIRNNKRKIASLQKLNDKIKAQAESAMAEIKTAPPEKKMELLNQFSALANKSQFFSEALGAATKTGSAGEFLSSQGRYDTAPVKPKPKPTVQPFVLDRVLAGAKPRYGYGSKLMGLNFASDLDKSLYIISQAKPSKSDAKYLKAVMDYTGMTEQEARSAGQEVRTAIKAQAKNGTTGQILQIPEIHEPFKSVAEPIPTPQSNVVQVQEAKGVPQGEPAQNLQAVPEGLTQDQEVEPPTLTNRKNGETEEAYRARVVGEIKKLGDKTYDSSSVFVDHKNQIDDLLNETGTPLEHLDKSPLTTGELEMLHNQINDLVIEGTNEWKVRQGVIDNEIEALKSEMKGAKSDPIVERLQTISPGERLPTATKVGNAIKNKLKVVLNNADKAGRSLLFRDAVLDIMDGPKSDYRGFLTTKFGNTFDRAYNQEHNLFHQLIEPIEAVLNKYKFDVPSLERVGMYLHVKQGARDRMIKSGAKPEIIDSLKLNDKELELADAIRDVLDNQSYPALKEVMKNLYNVDLEAVENYFPLQRDWNAYDNKPKDIKEIRVPEGAQMDEDDKAAYNLVAPDFLGGNTAQTKKGMTIERLPDAKGPIEMNAIKVLFRHLRQVSHLITHAKDMRILSKVAKTPEFRQKYGRLGQQYMMDLIDTIARDSAPAGSTQWALVDTLRNNMSLGVLGFRIISQLKNASSMAVVATQVTPRNLLSAVVEAQTKDGKAWLRKNMAEVYARISHEPAIADLARNAGPKQKALAKSAFWLDRFFDNLAVTSSAIGAYKDELERLGFNPEDYLALPVNKSALGRALVISRTAVPSPLRKDQPQALSRGAIFGRNMSITRALFQFQSSSLNQSTFIRHHIFDKFREGSTVSGSMALLAAIALIVSDAALTELSKKALAKKNNKKAEEAFVAQMATQMGQRVPFLGQVMDMGAYSRTGVPIYDTTINTMSAIHQLSTDKNRFGGKLIPSQRTDAKTDLITAAGVLSGIPGASTAGGLIKKNSSN